ncbi:TetR/AcrR family transcriptional regulator [Burkholderia paludis]|uniref:TetR/AcrR family transcriptional regulator n=1 Tax=Burkholderia paludis TaxID=1506587 RepID=UPI000AA79863|nr:TetR/AcrR family transcriptional regulator [Burkholderia paludis]
MKHDPFSAVHIRKVPRQRRSSNTVDLILATARRLWSERGPRGYTTNEIARVAGISVGSLYQYFPNKDAVLHALVQQELEQLIDALSSHHAWQREGSGLHDLILALVTHRGRFVTVQKMHCACADASGPAHVGELLAGIHDVFVSALERDEFVSDLEIRTVAVDMVAIIHGMLRAANPNPADDATQLVERIGRAVFGYLEASRR